MDIVERILAKLVGEEISVDDMKEVNGGLMAEYCMGNMYVTSSDGKSWTCDS